MFKKALLLLSVASLVTFNLHAQNRFCATDEVNNKLKEKYPQIAINEAKLEQEIAQRLASGNFTKYAKSTASYGQDTFDIPIVIHVIHDYGIENISDNSIFDAVQDWNDTYNKRYSDTSAVISPFKKYIGNGRINLRLAGRDPNGNPTKGITRRQSYLTSNAGDFAKYDGWPNSSYLNLWIIKSFASEHSGAGAYAYKPATGQAIPWYDGVICLAVQFNSDRTMEHEIAHTMNIDHVWGGTNKPNVMCGDDGVDDTPPTKGHGDSSQQLGCQPQHLYDTSCSRGYLKVYPSSIPGLDSLVDYPDTNNSQNIMDYTFCAKMFTKGQVVRMHESLQSNTAGRSNLWTQQNLNATGALLPRQDLPPVADFYVSNGYPAHAQRTFFLCSGVIDSMMFFNTSWNDTVTSVNWQFSNGAIKPTSSSTTFIRNQFTQPGWATVSLTATSNAGSSTTTKSVYVADKNYKISPLGYFQEFNPGGDLDKWPIFNYYDNQWKWELNNHVGYYDKTCIMFKGYDTRTFPQIYIGSPEGDFDDFFTPAFNLSGMTSGDCNINYMYASAALSAFTYDLNDSLQISYSKDCGKSWVNFPQGARKRQTLVNNGNYTSYYEPTWMGEWSLMSLDIPQAARVDGVYFRFRYRPGVSASNSPTGNNFYLDRINISNFPLGANTLITEERKVVVAPNPTQGTANIIISGDLNATANILVTDITGKVVFKTEQKITSQYTTVTIPENAIAVKGMYMVQVITNNQSQTEKLVVY